ncbi:hypothetical protein K4L44_08730 [Halosquirtibacter laminarini]|uniref:Uncharacterized protein n=1 Tax=Halosquirtibacter laminarini TaxID=3374600 RepID=A0AC61NLE4_9BACT|nr:hypothetical protein K4L44_08730 [Prolixibacteraceae bacterium]
MKQLLLLMLLSFSVLSCKEQGQSRDKNIIIEDTQQIIYTDTKAYIHTAYTHLTDSLDRESGFLGWKNIRDYFQLDEVSMQSKVEKIWFHFYDPKVVKKITKSNLEDALIAKGARKHRVRIHKIDTKPIIHIYAHKIVVSGVFMIIEEIVEYVMAYGIAVFFIFIIISAYVFYQFTLGGWIRWSKKRHAKVDSMTQNIWTWSRRVFGIVFFIGMLYMGDTANTQTEKYITNKILKQVETQVAYHLKGDINE